MAPRAADAEKHYDADADIVFVDQLEWPNKSTVGITDGHDRERIIVEWNSHSHSEIATIVAHEFGHGVGLDHTGHTKFDVMYEYLTGIEQTELESGDVDNYEGP